MHPDLKLQLLFVVKMDGTFYRFVFQVTFFYFKKCTINCVKLNDMVKLVYYLKSKKTIIFLVINLYIWFIFIACSKPPVVPNAKRTGPDRPAVGVVISYECNEGHFASGPNRMNLETECLSDLRYSLEVDDLAQCLAIGNLMKNLFLCKFYSYLLNFFFILSLLETRTDKFWRLWQRSEGPLRARWSNHVHLLPG